MRTTHIRALTGVRFLAALWVVLYHVFRHYSADIAATHPAVSAALGPLAWAGVRGVDLFFMLSGFVLALNYLDQLGPAPRPGAALRFLWLRLARIWPLYMLVILAGGGLRVLRHDLWGSAGTGPVTWTNLLRQALMVQKWFPPAHGPLSWVGPAWSLSAEWLAYLLFPLFALAVWRISRSAGPRTLLGLAGLVLVPLLVGITLTHALDSWVWVARILCEFVTGMLLCVAVSRAEPSPRARRLAGTGALVLGVLAAAWIELSPAVGFWTHAYVVVLFAPFLALLAVGTGPLPQLLGSRPLVIGGALSYALYLVHSPALHLVRDVSTHVVGLDRMQTCYVELASVPLLVLLAWALHHFFEEPVRRLMRRALGRLPARARDVAAEAAPVG